MDLLLVEDLDLREVVVTFFAFPFAAFLDLRFCLFDFFVDVAIIRDPFIKNTYMK